MHGTQEQPKRTEGLGRMRKRLFVVLSRLSKESSGFFDAVA